VKLPYQRYSELSFGDVHDEISSFHAKQQFALLKQTKHRAQLLLHLPLSDLQMFVGKEIEFWPGVPSEVSLPIPRRENSSLLRERSRLDLSDSPRLSFSVITQFISDALTCTDDFTQPFRHRLYPSGGGLYPIEVFLCKTSDNVDGWPAGDPVFHLKANSRELESMEATASALQIKETLSGFSDEIGAPQFALVYCMYLDKVIFKYKYRGYRTAMMEVGSMYQLCDLYAKQFGLKNRVWAGFYDGSVAKQININGSSVLPCVVQFFGQ
jgi:SagB-type dehydrogenase family enzyme